MTLKAQNASMVRMIAKAEKALKEAVKRAIKDHQRTGDPMYIWENGKVTKVSPEKILRRSA